ncbi:hypothetical protein DOTSEDRAFT_148289 [Dothistroma septosporum NZE10]|uniref:F-box domain-containing protein n=1 Tax=Dothistroma septosporum (strain NZE10 / CBS 128990) TaxID=675120 RepID=N1PV65_DOTSN|nr:hypothetical protein DOTSEDRAFT_148289 [Dothistroma septosporum NZE10]
MARLVTLGEDGAHEDAPPIGQDGLLATGSDNRSNPNLNQFTAALSCYPIVSLLASYMDLTTLSDLSQTCRQIRANLMQYRRLLKSKALRCENEQSSPAVRLGNALHASHAVWTAHGRNGLKVGRITSGKVGACARDMVADCRKCGHIICRNCVVKPPPASIIKLRHRRLCRTCMKSPLSELMSITRIIQEDGTSDETTPQQRTYARSPCTCEDFVWVCQPCGQTMRADDTTYTRGWKWRARYSHCGGIGAGLGEANEGVECGRTIDCLAARMVEKDVECDAAELAALCAETAKAEIDGRRWNGSSYSTQEIVGIGGKVKTKVKKRIPIGAIVKEYEDERDNEKFLDRERTGANRSWCSWCARVVAGKKDQDGATRSTDSIASTSSMSSGTV